MKICSNCKVEKADSEFSRKGDKLQSRCKKCHSEYTKQHYQENKEAYLARASVNNQKSRQEILNWIKALKSKPCTDCKVTYPYYVMHFDHLGLEEKLDNISRLARVPYSKKRLEAEIAKCELVCANCHSERTYQRAHVAQLVAGA